MPLAMRAPARYVSRQPLMPPLRDAAIISTLSPRHAIILLPYCRHAVACLMRHADFSPFH